MGSCGCKNGMKKGSRCSCNTCSGQRSKNYYRRIDGNKFIGSKIPIQKNIANELANRIRSKGNNARVIPAKGGFRVYVDPNRKYNHPIKMMQVVPNVFNRDRNNNGIYDSVEKLLIPRRYNRDVGVVRNEDIVALAMQAKDLNFNPDRTKDMIESRFGKALSEDWINRYSVRDGKTVLDGRLSDNRLLTDNLRNAGLRTNEDRNDMFFQLTDVAAMPEEKQLEKLNEVLGDQSNLYRQLQANDYDIDLEESSIRYFIDGKDTVELTFDEILLDGLVPSNTFGISYHVSRMIDSPYPEQGGQTTALIQATEYYKDDLVEDEVGDMIDEAIQEEYSSISPSPNDYGGYETLEETLNEQLDVTSYWSLIRSAYMSRLRDYDRKMNFKPHMMYNSETGEGKLAETYEDHINWKNKGWTHTGYSRKLEDALGDTRTYTSGGGDLPTMSIGSGARTFLPLFKNSPPRKDDEMYYNSDGSKREYVKKNINGETYYGYFVDSLGRRGE